MLDTNWMVVVELCTGFRSVDFSKVRHADFAVFTICEMALGIDEFGI